MEEYLANNDSPRVRCISTYMYFDFDLKYFTLPLIRAQPELAVG